MPNGFHWLESNRSSGFAPLAENLTVDTLVVGGGLTGVTAAYLLTTAGQKVALLERDRIGAGDTGKTTAHLTAAMDMRLSELADRFGDAGARSLWDAGDAAIQQIFTNADTCGIDCDLATVAGYLHLPGAGNEAELKRLRADAAVAERLDIPATYVAMTPFFNTPGVRFVNQARFHPGKYLAGMVRELERRGCRLFENTAAGEFANGKTVHAGEYAITAGRVVIATHNPITGYSSTMDATLMQTKLAVYTSYVVCATVPPASVPDCLFWDTQEPYNYMRLQAGDEGDLLIYGGRDHKTGQEDDTESVFELLEMQLWELLSKNKIDGRIAGRWSGQVIETVDGAPYIGEFAENQFAATGFAGNGMRFGTLAAMMAADWILDRKNPWSDLLAPARKKIPGGVLDYIRENADYPYYMMRDRLLASGSGERARLSPICPHMGCVVHWNSAEKTWDCPCHGSRFRATGEVISGPAETPLKGLP